MGEDRILGGIAQKYDVQGYDPVAAKQCFFDVYISIISDPSVSIAYPGEQQTHNKRYELSEHGISTQLGIVLACNVTRRPR